LPNFFTHKIETETAKVGRLLIATHLEQSNQLANQQLVFNFAAPVSYQPLHPVPDSYHFAEPSHCVLTFVHPKFIVQCIGGVAFTRTLFFIQTLKKTLIIRLQF
jgi:hypothetical protein